MTISVKTASILVLIPARFHSTRLPGKPLVMLEGKSLIFRVAQRAREIVEALKSQGLKARSVVVTDHDQVETHLKDHGFEVVRVDDDVPSGSERLFLAYDRFFRQERPDLIVNLQGDEPFIEVQSIVDLAHAHLDRNNRDVMTLVIRRVGKSVEFSNPNRVKVAFAKKTLQCLYFSRSPIPYDREGDQADLEWFQHVGVYSYRPEALERFCAEELSPLESVEKLEQLRGLELGLVYGALPISYEPLGVDTPEDKLKVEGVLRGETPGE